MIMIISRFSKKKNIFYFKEMVQHFGIHLLSWAISSSLTLNMELEQSQFSLGQHNVSHKVTVL